MSPESWVILLTDRRRLGAPVRLVARGVPETPTERADGAKTFRDVVEARDWWRDHAAVWGFESRFVPTFTRAAELSPGEVSS